jgi:wobble nucleotide-excising tRNase
MLFKDINSLSDYIKEGVFRNKKIALIYAFNGTGKTRLANSFYSDEEYIESLVYNAHFEDDFTWDNTNNEINFDYENNWLFDLIRDEGLDGKVTDNFKRHTHSRIEPIMDFSRGTIRFQVINDDGKSYDDSIKISRAEERILVWSVFYTVLSHAVELLYEDIDDRSSYAFNRLRHVVIDDPVSSMDDTRLIGVAMDVADICERLAALDNPIKAVILTHHGLFYNVVHNILSKKKNKLQSYLLSKRDDELLLSEQTSTPFAYHLFTKDEIQKAIEDDSIERYHFNIFRALLEKTANFLGYKSWDRCLIAIAEDEFVKLMNHYSHNQYSDTEPREIPHEEAEQFKEVFNSFMKGYNWNIDDGK